MLVDFQIKKYNKSAALQNEIRDFCTQSSKCDSSANILLSFPIKYLNELRLRENSGALKMEGLLL